MTMISLMMKFIISGLTNSKNCKKLKKYNSIR